MNLKNDHLKSIIHNKGPFTENEYDNQKVNKQNNKLRSPRNF